MVDPKQRKLSFGMLSSIKTRENREQTEAGSFAGVSTTVQDIHIDSDNKQDEIQVPVLAVPDVQIPAREKQKQKC